MAQTGKHLPTMQETWVRSLSQEDPLEKEIATHTSTLAWKNPIDRGSCCATVHGVAKSRAQLSNFTSLHFNPMENSMDRGAWWAPLGLQGVHGVTKSQTQLSN